VTICSRPCRGRSGFSPDRICAGEQQRFACTRTRKPFCFVEAVRLGLGCVACGCAPHADALRRVVARAGRGGERRMRRASDVRVFHGRLLSVLAQAAHHIPRRPSSLQPVTRVSTCVCRAKERWAGGGSGRGRKGEREAGRDLGLFIVINAQIHFHTTHGQPDFSRYDEQHTRHAVWGFND
jgi:hypothetical protein